MERSDPSYNPAHLRAVARDYNGPFLPSALSSPRVKQVAQPAISRQADVGDLKAQLWHRELTALPLGMIAFVLFSMAACGLSVVGASPSGTPVPDLRLLGSLFAASVAMGAVAVGLGIQCLRLDSHIRELESQGRIE